MDAKTAVALCIEGHIKDILKKDNKLDGYWISEHVVAHTFKMQKDKMTVVALGGYADFDAEAQDLVSLYIIKRVHTVYQ